MISPKMLINFLSCDSSEAAHHRFLLQFMAKTSERTIVGNKEKKNEISLIFLLPLMLKC